MGPLPILLRRLSHRVALCLTLLIGLAARADDNFPRPPALEPDVDFWVRVYSEIDTRSGFIHDAYRLDIVYETLQLSGQRRADEKAIRAARQRYSRILQALAEGKQPTGPEQKRVMALWGDAGPARLREAAGDVRFQRGQSDRFRAGLARSGLWQDHIERVLADRGLPMELAALPHVESSFNPEAYSSVGAAGIWQFTRSTGRRYLQVDYVVDERMDPFAATEGAAKLLEHNYQLTGSWPLAVTAYNHGAAGVRRAAKQLGTTDIDVIVRRYRGRAFGFASRNFYLSFLAAVEVSRNPSRYFPPYDSHPPVPYAQVSMPDYVPVDAFARAFDVDLDQLKAHNRALLDPVWRGKKHIPRDFTMRVPRHALSDSPEALLAGLPADQRFDEQTPDRFHKVVPGDTVSEIATRYGHSIRDVAAMNGLDRRYRIRIGQVLRLPLGGQPVPQDAGTEAPAEVAAALPAGAPGPVPEGEESSSELASTVVVAELTADPSDYTVAADGSIEVQAAETLGHYADWLDLRASELRRLNGMPYGRPVVLGRRLKLDFSRVEVGEFERRRLAYQHQLQQSFFMTWQIQRTHSHVIAPGESLWVLTRQRYKVPMWLLRQYNPDLKLDRLKPGMVVVIPELVKT
jgi:membrane-bound lytic murein transglycosylase D